MKLYYVQFTGRFRTGTPAKGLCSSCIVPESKRKAAEARRLEALDKEGVDLVEVDDAFVVDDDELDPDVELFNED
jgi:hypothetical protein